MYIVYEDYQSAGGQLSKADFEKYEPRAEMYLDNLTLKRLRKKWVIDDLKERNCWSDVVLALVILVDACEGIAEDYAAQADGSKVTSFGNSKVTLGFGSKLSGQSENNDALGAAYDQLLMTLPVELVSAAVTRYGAN